MSTCVATCKPLSRYELSTLAGPEAGQLGTLSVVRVSAFVLVSAQQRRSVNCLIGIKCVHVVIYS